MFPEPLRLCGRVFSVDGRAVLTAGPCDNAPVKRSGVADLPLHGGRVPAWLATRMVTLGGRFFLDLV